MLTPRQTLNCVVPCLVATMWTATAHAQLPPAPLKPLDPNVGDVSPLSTNFRDFSVDLRGPAGFARVYQVPGNSSQLMRASGALYATFGYSAYRPSEKGTQVLVPAGTVFHIGAPWQTPLGQGVANKEDEDEDAPTMRMVLRMSPEPVAKFEQPQLTGAVREESTDLRGWVLAPRVVEQSPETHESEGLKDEPAPRDGAGDVTIATSETYRARRLSELMRRAAEAERARARQSPESGAPVTADAADDDSN